MDDRNVKMHSYSNNIDKDRNEVKENRGEDMSVDEYLKFKTSTSSSRQLKPSPSINKLQNTPIGPSSLQRLLRRGSSKLPALRQTSSVESFTLPSATPALQSSNLDEKTLRHSSSRKGSSKRRIIDVKRLFPDMQTSSSNNKRNESQSSAVMQKILTLNNDKLAQQQAAAMQELNASKTLSSATNTTQADTLMGNSVAEDSQINNTLMRALIDSTFTSNTPNGLNLTKLENSQVLPKTNSVFENPSDEMIRRWKEVIEKSLPAIDLIDLAALHDPYHSTKRQFAPEYSQKAYLEMLSKEYAIGDFIELEGPFQVSENARRHMITLLEDLHRLKAYKEETLYLAASLCDRYLVNLAVKGQSAPCLIKLAIITTLMAAKLEQPMQPSYNRMIRLVASEWKFVVSKQEIFDLEESIIRNLDFDLHFTGPIPFLERFQRVYNLDNVRRDKEAFQLDYLARNFCRCFLRTRNYLSLRPSQVGAAALILAINLSSSSLAPQFGFQRMQDLNLKSLFFENVINIEVDGVRQKSKNESCPLKMWNKVVRRTTALKIQDDLMPAYIQMCTVVNRNELNGKLADKPQLFLIQGEQNRQSHPAAQQSQRVRF